MDDLGRIGIIVAARMDSKRLPGKALKPLSGIPMLAFLIRRLKTTQRAREIILATSSHPQDDPLESLAKKEGASVYRGSLEDVVERHVLAAEKFNIDSVVRVTGDCPFVNGELVDHVLQEASGQPFDLCTTKGEFPVGLDAEIYKASHMKELHESSALNDEQREHLTLYYYQNKNSYRINKIIPPSDWADNKIYTIDDINDYTRALTFVERFKDVDVSIASLTEHSFDE